MQIKTKLQTYCESNHMTNKDLESDTYSNAIKNDNEKESDKAVHQLTSTSLLDELSTFLYKYQDHLNFYGSTANI